MSKVSIQHLRKSFPGLIDARDIGRGHLPGGFSLASYDHHVDRETGALLGIKVTGDGEVVYDII